ncbi:hypothetical protein Esti_002592 [Eimeria stiedai]
MAALPNGDTEAQPRSSGLAPLGDVPAAGCCCSAAAAAATATAAAAQQPPTRCRAFKAEGGPASPEVTCYFRGPHLPAWMQTSAAGTASGGSCCSKETSVSCCSRPYSWYSSSSVSPASTGGCGSPPICCSTAVSPASRCEQPSCCGSPLIRWGDCCCSSGVQLQQLRCGPDKPMLQHLAAATAAADSPTALHASLVDCQQTKGSTNAAKTARAAAAEAGLAAKNGLTIPGANFAEERQETVDTEEEKETPRCYSRPQGSPSLLAAANTPAAAEAAGAAAEAATEAAAAAAAEAAAPSSSFPRADQARAEAGPSADAAATDAAAAAANTAEATAAAAAAAAATAADADAEGWISVKPRRQRRWADVSFSEDDETAALRHNRRPPLQPQVAAAARQQQRHLGPAAPRQRKPCSYGDGAAAAAAAAATRRQPQTHHHHHPHTPSTCVFSAAVAAGLVVPTRDTYVASSEQQQQQQQAGADSSRYSSSSYSSTSCSSSSDSSSNSSSSRSSAFVVCACCCRHDACGGETNGSNKATSIRATSSSSSSAKGRLQEEYERGLLPIGRAGSLRGVMHLWRMLTARALASPSNVAVAIWGCMPLWEDPVNRAGGHFAIRSLAGRAQAVHVFFLLLKSLDQQQPPRARRPPASALLSALTGIVLCLRNNDRSHKVEVWVGSTASQTVRQQELQLRELLSCMSPGPCKLDLAFLSHEACLSKNQRKLRLKPQRKPDATPLTADLALQSSPRQLQQQQRDDEQRQQQQQQEQQAQQRGCLPPQRQDAQEDEAAAAEASSPCPATMEAAAAATAADAAAIKAEGRASLGMLPSLLLDLASSTCSRTDTGGSGRSSNKDRGISSSSRGSSESRSSLFGETRGAPHLSYKSIILKGSSHARSELQQHQQQQRDCVGVPHAKFSQQQAGSRSVDAEGQGVGSVVDTEDTAELLSERTRQQQMRQQQGRLSSSSKTVSGLGVAAAGKTSSAEASHERDTVYLRNGTGAAEPAAAGASTRGFKAQKGAGATAADCGPRGKRLGRQKAQRRHLGGGYGGAGFCICPEQRLLQHLYAFDAREIPDYFTMQQAAYQGKAPLYASYAACASAAVNAETAAAQQQQQQQISSGDMWDFPPLSSAAAGSRWQVQKQQQQQRQAGLQLPTHGGEERSNRNSSNNSSSSSSCSGVEEGAAGAAKECKHFAFNPYAPGFIMPPHHPLSALGASAESLAGPAAAAAARDMPAELLLEAGGGPSERVAAGALPCAVAAAGAGESVPPAAVAAAEAAATANYMSCLLDADFVDPGDPSSLLLVTLMLHPALDDAPPLQVPLLPLALLEGDMQATEETVEDPSSSSSASSSTTSSSSRPASPVYLLEEPLDAASQSRLSLTLDYEETTQTLSLDIVQS